MSKTKIVKKIVRFELFLTVIGQLCKSDQLWEDIPVDIVYRDLMQISPIVEG